MGVHSLWDIVGPAARPVKLEALSRKKLAVDASIWIYQFIKAVRDKDGNSLGQTHIVGFFRRICKLLYFGIRPLFVFDGGAPALKRKVIQNRREKRQENHDNAATAAQKLLAMQLRGKASARRAAPATAAPAAGGDAGAVYFSDLPSNATPAAEPPARAFRKADEYHLPELAQFTVRRGDQRIMPESEFQELADGQAADTVDGVNIDAVDPSSAAFGELPMATQYMILSSLRLRSRLRLGYTKHQLEHLFPDSKDFSRFQIQQVQKRNYYTQRLMNVSGMAEDTGTVTRRLAGDRDRQYMLVKNDGGWTLSLGAGDTVDVDADADANDLDDFDTVDRVKREPPAADGAERVAIKSESDSDDLEDVPLEDVPLAASGAPLSGDDADRALIEAIYAQYPDEHTAPFGLNVAAARNKRSLREEFSTLDDADMKRAIEESKRDYYRVRQQEQAAAGPAPASASAKSAGPKRTKPTQAKPTNPSKPLKSAPAEYDFANSLLFGGPAVGPETPKETETAPFSRTPGEQEMPLKIQEEPEIISETPRRTEEEVTKPPRESVPEILREESGTEVLPKEAPQGVIIESDSEPSDKVDSEPEPERKMPSWFNESHLASPHSSVGFLQDRPPSKKLDENEEAGLISWVEARELLQNNSDESDVEVIETRPLVEEVEEVVEAETGPEQENDGEKMSGPEQEKNREKRNGLETVNNGEHTNEEKRKENANELGEEEAKSTSPGSAPGRGQVLDYDFSEDEEVQLIQQLHEEEHEHESFASRIQEDIPIHTTVTTDQLLQEQVQKAKRDAEEVTQTMINDVQELLKRFGIPYITAPMEAEAQCAELYRLKLVDGIITDDSDCFLFGGSRIYKNMFNQKQYVECYTAEDIEHKCGLTQNKLIELALLLGSDYTDGVKGIGPVLAMEILAEFADLRRFKAWFDANTKTLAGDIDENSKLQKNLLAKIRAGKLFLADTFPDKVVAEAYLRPEVDRDESEFKWGIPSLDKIRSFLMYNVGWTQERVDEVMVPLVRNMNRTAQTTIGEFFPQEYISYKEVAMGKRMKVAANRLRKGKAKAKET